MIPEGLVVCAYCNGHGAFNIGCVLPLGCHRCVDGLTTASFQRAAQNWEAVCGGSDVKSRDAAFLAYVEAKAGRDLLLAPRWYEKLNR